MPHTPLKSEHPEWRVVLFRAGSMVDDVMYNGLMIGEVAPSSLSFSRHIREIGSVTFDMNLGHTLGTRDKVEPYATDFILMHKEHHIMGGIVTGVNVNDDTEWLSIAGKDYLHYFEKRIWPIDPLNPTIYAVVEEDSFTVLTDILDTVLMEPYSLPLEYNLGLSGIDVNYRIEAGDSEPIFDKIRDLSEQDPGFDFRTHVDVIDGMAHVELMAESPKMGVANDFTFEKGRNIKSISYDCIGARATWVAGFGAGSSKKIVKVSSQPLDMMEMYRRLDHTVDVGDIIDPRVVQRQTTAEGERMAHSHRDEFSVTYIPEPNVDLWVEVQLGDTCRVIYDTRYEQINDEFRVVGFEVSPTDQGDEEVLVIFEDAEV